MLMSAASALLGLSRERIIDLLDDARCVTGHHCVNTSLSWTLFFSTCWCIRDVVHLDSRVRAAK
ncbi:hypothetical protein JQ615_12390 [Bradyrhizobium jicamae]|uniref:Uncharacterized protein n=1 Tax=Bradyrhizobium jicamae TaxID=280332 RepID=A0ABS5FHB7_9BRAD|nr:hypothetical protein [Bradyrhizobium jicamae]MBR0796187.1 hypothetical protein [Bradyrhizobium jicamae]MBR0937738.1 hypothetical protein [Bradyrhizobium jicamae]